ncbi:MAG: DUF362 domain-containing protein [Chloroflexi bacterium]|nr:DUF362 domain-containing protein [Chloroflexota bacterium]
MASKLSRRQFLKLAGTVGGALLVSACERFLPTEAVQPLPPTATATPPLETPTPTLSPTPGPKAVVAIGKAEQYDQALIRSELERMLDSMGGITDVVRPGAKVGIKVNMTGAYYQDGFVSPSPVEWYATNPAVVGALCELLIDAGASKIYVVEGLGTAKPSVWDLWGYKEMADTVGAELLDTSYPDPYDDFTDAPVGEGWFIHETYKFNAVLTELDTFVSIGKMKPHAFAGMTMSMKNLMGLTPLSVYRYLPGQTWRQSLHGDRQMDTRLPRVLLDLNRARPIHLALADGIMTMEGGADPWEDGVAQVKPGILLASKNPLAMDATGARLMGFDPAAASGSVPFLHIENYLALAQEIGMGTIAREEIGLTGYTIEEMAYQFKPAP